MPMDRPPTSAETERRFEDLADELAARGVVRGTMFGVPTLKTDAGKAVACLWGDALVFKLPPDLAEEARALEGAEAFDPMGGRKMKEWVVVPAAHASRWASFGAAAAAYVGKQTRVGR